MYYVYVLENLDSKGWYIGFTENLDQRINQHIQGRGGRTTRMNPGWQLIYAEQYLVKTDALGREKFLKGGSGRTYLKKQLRNYLNKNSN